MSKTVYMLEEAEVRELLKRSEERLRIVDDGLKERIRALEKKVNRYGEVCCNRYTICQESGEKSVNVDVDLARRIAELERVMKESNWEQVSTALSSRLKEAVEEVRQHREQGESESRLEPCPFCPGIQDLYVVESGDTVGYCNVRCMKCRCEGPPRRTEAEARKAWNKRRPEPFAAE